MGFTKSGSFRYATMGALLAALTLTAPQAKSATLPLYDAYPDILTNDLSVSYTYDSATSTGTLVATGSIAPADNDLWKLYTSAANRTHFPSPISTSYNTGTFDLTVSFTVAGAGTSEILTPTAGTLNVTAGCTAPMTPVPVQTIFSSSTVYAVGYDVQSNGNGSDTWEFEFGQGGGLYGNNPLLGVILHGGGSTTYTASHAAYNSSPIDLTKNFITLSKSGSADTFVAPLPPAALMALSSPAALVLLRRRKTTQV